jgi:hypothetical protein
MNVPNDCTHRCFSDITPPEPSQRPQASITLRFQLDVICTRTRCRNHYVTRDSHEGTFLHTQTTRMSVTRPRKCRMERRIQKRNIKKCGVVLLGRGDRYYCGLLVLAISVFRLNVLI